MMPATFAQPEWLFALVLPVLLTIWECVRRQHAVVLPLDHAGAPSGRWLGRILRAASVLPALLLAVAIVLLAEPQRPGEPGEQRVLTNIEFVVDVSGSMESRFGDGTRYDGSIAAIEAFTRHRRGDAIGLTIFGDEVLHWTPLTKDVAAIRTAAPFLRPENMPPQFGGTRIGKALRASLARVRDRGEGDGCMVLFSDGESADFDGGAARQLGLELAGAGVVLYAIHVGDDNVPSDLYDLTRSGGGQVFAARDDAALAAVFARIDQLQPARVRPTAPRPIDAFVLPAIAGLAVLGVYQLSLLGLRYTPW